MTSHPGAIVLIVFYSLRDMGRLRAWFSTTELSTGIQRLRSAPQAKRVFVSFIHMYMKHHRKEFPTTLLTEAGLKGWLRLHVDKKPVYWFEERSGRFRLRQEHVSRLSRYMP